MAKLLLADEIHVRVFVPAGLGAAAGRAVRRALDSPRFRRHFRRAVRAAFGRFAPLRHARVHIVR